MFFLKECFTKKLNIWLIDTKYKLNNTMYTMDIFKII